MNNKQEAFKKIIIDVILSWPRIEDVVKFAISRHGYGNSDGGFGVIYWSDLDDYERIQGASLDKGLVAVYGLWGPPSGEEIIVSEKFYLTILEELLRKNGLSCLESKIFELKKNID